MKDFVKLKTNLTVKYLPKDVRVFTNCIYGAFGGSDMSFAKEDIVLKLLSTWKEKETWMAVSYEHFVSNIGEYLDDITQDAIDANLFGYNCDHMSRYFFRDDILLMSELAIRHGWDENYLFVFIVMTVDALENDKYIEIFRVNRGRGSELYIAPTDKLLNHLEEYFKRNTKHEKAN